MSDPSTIEYLRTKCVTKISNKINDYYYPKTLPRERGPLVNVCFATLLIGIIAVLSLAENNKLQTFAEISFLIFIYLIMEVIYRIILFFEEVKQIKSRYDNKYLNLFQELFNFSKSYTILLLFCVFVILFSGIDILSLLQIKLFAFVPIGYLINKLFPMGTNYLVESLRISKNNGLDYGAGMAYSFFYGYLKLVLEKTGEDPSKNFAELINEYENRHNVKFAQQKLFILIPQSCKCPISLENEYSPTVESSGSLPEKVITVSGVKNRVYKNAVYKIKKYLHKDGKQEFKLIYVSAEFATPLKTFNDVVEHESKHSSLYKKMKNDIILQFYLTLRHILEEKKLHHFCELIYFDDINEDGDFHDIGQVILTRIRELAHLKKYKTK